MVRFGFRVWSVLRCGADAFTFMVLNVTSAQLTTPCSEVSEPRRTAEDTQLRRAAGMIRRMLREVDKRVTERHQMYRYYTAQFETLGSVLGFTLSSHVTSHPPSLFVGKPASTHPAQPAAQRQAPAGH
jgi:beta-xylosidase